MNVDGFLSSLKGSSDYAGQIVHVHEESEREPVWATVPEGFDGKMQSFLAGLGVTEIYRHQSEAIQAALDGKDVLITTGPASGKSLCYQVPILRSLLEAPTATSLLVFPAKALARDQAAAWNRGIGSISPTTDVNRPVAVPFDADASRGERRSAQAAARLIVTNPEMLHLNLLPRHAPWSRLLTGLKFVVLDEVHTYTGFFGANMANVIRRLLRLCEHYGSKPQFICSSATVANPKELVERITGRPIHHVAEDASAAGTKTFVFWNPPPHQKTRMEGQAQLERRGP